MAALDVCAAVISDGRRFLLATRPDGTHLAGKWEFPGGKLRDGETLNECVERELLEELSLDVAASGCCGVVEYSYPGKAVRLHFIRCRVTGNSVADGRDGQDVGWFTREDMDALDLAPADRQFVERVPARDWV